MDADTALANLTQVSPCINAAVIFDSEGSAIAATLDDERAERMAARAAELLASVPDGDTVVQLEAATKDGSVFVVRDGERAIAATTSPAPVIGLVMYDLRTCLSSLELEPA